MIAYEVVDDLAPLPQVAPRHLEKVVVEEEIRDFLFVSLD
jgi:hypothetical protein